MNIVILTGRLTATPELRKTESGVSVSSFSIAVDRKFSKEDRPDFINCVAWRNTAEFITKYFTKGQSIAIEGTLHQNSYTDKESIKRTTYDVQVSNAEFCGSKSVKSENNNIPDNLSKTSDFDEADSIPAEDLLF